MPRWQVRDRIVASGSPHRYGAAVNDRPAGPASRAVASRRPPHAALSAFLLLVLVLAACAGAPAEPPLPRLRIVVWNIHHGEGLDGRVDVPRLAAELRRLEPDFVLLQEVDVGCRRSGGVDTPAVLAEQLSMHAAFAQNIPFQGGSYGNAILSRWPIESQQNRHYRMLREGEQRGLLTARVESPAGRLAVGCTHVDYRPDDAERLANAAEVLEVVRAEGLLVVGGDFNDLPDSRVHRKLCGSLVDCWIEAASEAGAEVAEVAEGAEGFSYPAAAPAKRIDWLLRAAPGWRTVAARVVPTAASDHCPVLFELRRER